jgi:hypothetical protein
MTSYSSRIMVAMNAERDALGLIGGKPLPVEVRDRVLNAQVEIFIGEALAKKTVQPRKKKESEMTDEEWIKSLEAEPALRGVNIRKEIERCNFWYRQNISKVGVPTRRRLVNWLNKAERVVDLKAAGASHASGLKLPAPKGPEGWMAWANTELSLISEEHPAHGQVTAAVNCQSFTMLPGSWQAKAHAACLANNFTTLPNEISQQQILRHA